MRFSTQILLIFLIAAPALAEEDARRCQINAATSEAFETLRREVYAMPLTRDVNVGRFIDACHARDEFNEIFQSAHQIGGARWLDDKTVQVRLELPGDIVAKRLEGIAIRMPDHLPVPLRTLRERYKPDFLNRTFAATGMSTAASAACRLRPDPSQAAWRAVSDKDRRAAVEAAQQSAIGRVIESLRTIEFGNGRRLGDAMDVPAMKNAISAWLADRPITWIEFRDDLEVRISLAASAHDLWPILQAALLKQETEFQPRSPQEWEQLHQNVTKWLAPASGRALATASGPPRGQPIAIPRDPPAWVQGATFESVGLSGPIGGSKLRTARAAEAVALTQLRAKLEALPLSADLTIGQAAKKDPHIEQALCRSLDQARVAKAEYDVPSIGAVRVKLTVDPQIVWRELGGK